MNSREQFEEAFPVPSNIRWSEEHQSYGYIVRNSPNLSQVHRYRSMWNAWQESRQALEIVLPEPRKVRNGYPESVADDMGFNDGLESCRDAIEAAGLKVKP